MVPHTEGLAAVGEAAFLLGTIVGIATAGGDENDGGRPLPSTTTASTSTTTSTTSSTSVVSTSTAVQLHVDQQRAPTRARSGVPAPRCPT